MQGEYKLWVYGEMMAHHSQVAVELRSSSSHTASRLHLVCRASSVSELVKVSPLDPAEAATEGESETRDT